MQSSTLSLSLRGPSLLLQGRHTGPYLFAVKALATCILQQGLSSTDAPIRHPRLPEHCAPLQVYPKNLVDYSTGNPTQSKLAIHYCILLHIMKIIYIYLNHLLELVGPVLSTGAVSSLRVVTWLGCPPQCQLLTPIDCYKFKFTVKSTLI